MIKIFTKLVMLAVAFVAGVLFTFDMDLDSKAWAQNAHDIDTPQIPEISQVFADVAEMAMPSVVTITSARTYQVPVRSGPSFRNDPFFEYFFGQQRRPQQYREFVQEGLGSGVIVSSAGYILTNAHVIDGADEIEVHLEGEKYPAELIGMDAKTDIAVLKMEPDDYAGDNLPVAKLGKSQDLRIGEWVLAIGSPFQLDHTVTSGIVSALGRSRMGIVDYEDFIQTDAAINPGNSGGALVNLRGEMIGINTVIYSGNGGNIGIGFAIPVDLASQVMDQLIDHGRVVRGWMGVTIQDINQSLAQSLGLESDHGVLVSSVVPGSPAEVAGLVRGDVVLAIDDVTMQSTDVLRNYIGSRAPGDKVELALFHDGKTMARTVELGDIPGEENFALASSPREDATDFGLMVSNLSYEIRNNIRYDGHGVIVESVEPLSQGNDLGIQRGDIIVEINRKPITDIRDYNSAIENLRSKENVMVVVWRNGFTMYLAGKIS